MSKMSRPACGSPAFTEHRHSRSPDCVHQLILMDTNNDLNFIGGFAGSLMD